MTQIWQIYGLRSTSLRQFVARFRTIKKILNWSGGPGGTMESDSDY